MSIQNLLNFGKMKSIESILFDIDSRLTDIVIQLSGVDCESFHDALLIHKAMVSIDAASNYLFRIRHENSYSR